MTGRTEISKFWKLAPAIALASAIALLLAGLIMAFYNERAYEAQKINEVSVQAQILASSVTAALAFNDRVAAQEYVNALKANPEIRAAAVYDASGALLASYSRAESLPAPEAAQPSEPHFEGNRLIVAAPVSQDGSPLGTVYLRTVTEPFAMRLARYAGIALLVSMAALVVVVLGMAQAALTRANAELESRASALADANRKLQAQIEERERAEEALRQSQKMEAIGQLTGGIAHDFNNLLQVIAGNLDLVAPEVKDNDRTSRRLRNALAGTERAARLTQQLLAFARRQALEPKVVSLGRLMGETADLLRRTLGETIEVESVVAGGLWNTLTDVAQLENTILNLALNARDAMPDGGKLTLEVANASLDDAYARQHSEVKAGQYVMIAVTDTGVGMTPEQAERAFEPFFTTKPEGQGTGLGLSQVYGFVKQSGGHVKIYSESGHGTSVKIYLPRSRQAEGQTSAPLTASATGRGECVLVVEDDTAVREAAVDMLDELGYRVLQAEDGSSALTILRGGARIDLLFTDVVMPGPVKSRELARHAATLQPGIAVLFTSGYTENAIIHHGRLDADVFLLSKPYRKEELARKVRAVLGTRPVPARAANDGRGPRLRVLLVEDDALVRLSTIDMIEALGHDVLEAASAEAALKLIESVDGVDVLFTDVGLPDMSGSALASELRRRHPGLKVVLATGYSELPERPDDPKTGETSDGAVIHLGKPYRGSDVERAFTRLIGG
jgi:signal transduction histidine kinase/FixJ family two-component response regulator